MQTSMPKCWRKGRWMVLWLLACISLSGYSLYAWLTYPQFPECKANVHQVYEIGGKRIKLAQLLRIESSGWRETTLLLNGQINDNQERFDISRLLVFRYTYSGGLFHMRLKDVVKGEADSVTRQDLINLVPPLWENAYLKVEKMSGGNYLITSSHQLFLVCTAP